MTDEDEDKLWEAMNRRLDGLRLVHNAVILLGEVRVPWWKRVWWRIRCR